MEDRPAVRAAQELGGDFKYAVEWHLAHGFIYASDLVFGMARPVLSTWDLDTLNDPANVALTDEADAWYFQCVVGQAAEAFSRLPFPLPHCMWFREKNAKLQKIRYERLQSLLLHEPRRTIGFLQ